MSLQIHLPLNGNLSNKGNNSITPSAINNMAFDNSNKFGNALWLTQDGQGINLPNYMTTMGSYSTYTMSAWVYLSSAATNHSTTIISTGDWNYAANQAVFGLYNYNNGYQVLLVPNRSGWSQGITLPSKITLNNWYHLAITYNGSVTKGYVNGVYVGSYSGGGITTTSNSSNVNVGRATYYEGFTLHGWMGDVRIYNNVLSDNEISDLYNISYLGVQVWAPLNGNLTNRGTIYQILTSTGASINNSGKIGECYSMSAAANNAIKGYYCSNSTNISFCIWVKFNSLSSGTHLLDGRSGDTFGYQPMYIESTRIQVGNGATSFPDVSYNFSTGVWYHIAVCYSANNIKVYINGSLIATTTDSRGYNYNGQLPFYIGSRFTGTNPLNGLVNDFRIYDYTLSEKEVKSIARALCMYYPLDNNGFNNLNLLYDFDTSFLSYSNGATTLFTNQMNSGTEEIVSNINGATKCLHLRSAGGNGRVYRTWPLTKGITYTLSADFYSTGVSSNYGAMHTEMNGGDYSWSGNWTSYNTPGQWERISQTWTPTSDTTLYYFFHSPTNVDTYIKNIKLEENLARTSWNYGLTEQDKTTVGIREWPVHYDTTIYRESDGSKWLRLVHHNNPASSGLFSSSDSFATGVYKSADKWYDAEPAIARAQSYEFMVKQKTTSDAAEVKYRWIQNVSPLTATYNDVIKTRVIRITGSGYTDGGYGGLWRMNNSARMVIANDTSSNWYGACGSWTEWSSQLPGYPNTAISSGYFDLYMRINAAEEFDRSGMGNDATLNTAGIKYQGNSIRNNSSTYLNGINDCLIIPFDASRWQSDFTMNIWFKKSQLGSKGYETLFGGPSGFEMDTRAGSASTLTLYMASTRGGNITGNGFSSFEFNKWYMVTMVSTSSNESYYVNGQFIKTIEKKAMPSGTYYIGAWASTTQQNYEGLISDARVYATALSSDDILALYQGKI